MTTLEFQAIRKTFGSAVALERFDLDVHHGELISLLGPSGCGKTTALRITAGFETSDSGSVLVGGTEIGSIPAHKRNMGMVFQSYSLFPNLSVAQNIEFGLRTHGRAKGVRRDRVSEMLELVQLVEHADKYPHQLSGGQQQRVALARALAVEPQVLLLDEPLSALDAKVRTSLRDEIRHIQTEFGITTLFVTHDQEEALAMSDRVCIMSNGCVEQLGTPTEIYRTPKTAFVARFVGSMNEIPAVVDAGHALNVRQHRIATPSAAAYACGTNVMLLVRPEALSLSEEGLDGSVTNVVFQGATTRVSVVLDHLNLLVQANIAAGRADHLRLGDRIAVSIDGTHGVCEAPMAP
jgi:putative spermidine/putrescine transport system ATP-binding protein